MKALACEKPYDPRDPAVAPQLDGRHLRPLVAIEESRGRCHVRLPIDDRGHEKRDVFGIKLTIPINVDKDVDALSKRDSHRLLEARPQPLVGGVADDVSATLPCPLRSRIAGAVVDDQHVDSLDAGDPMRNSADDTTDCLLFVQARNHDQQGETGRRRIVHVACWWSFGLVDRQLSYFRHGWNRYQVVS